MTSPTGRLMSVWKRRSRLVRIPYQMAVGVHHRYSSDAVLAHKPQGVGHGFLPGDGDGIVDHSRVGAFHLAYLRSLARYRHVLVDHADTSLAGNRYRHLGLGHSVHRRRHQRDVQRDVAREAGLEGSHHIRCHV